MVRGYAQRGTDALTLPSSGMLHISHQDSSSRWRVVDMYRLDVAGTCNHHHTLPVDLERKAGERGGGSTVDGSLGLDWTLPFSHCCESMCEYASQSFWTPRSSSLQQPAPACGTNWFDNAAASSSNVAQPDSLLGNNK